MKPEVLDVVDQVLGEVAVAQALTPGAEVDLVGAHRTGVRVAPGAALHPRAVVPRVGRVVDDRAGVRGCLGAPRHGVGLGADDVVSAADLELVDVAGPDIGNEELPDPGAADHPHGVDPAVPCVEVTDDPDRLRPRCPHGERRPAHRSHRAVVVADPGPEDGPQLLVPALADEVEVDVPQGGCEPVGVVLLVLDAVGPRREDAVVHRPGGAAADGRPHALGLVLEGELDTVLEPDPDRGGQRLEDPDPQATALEMLAEEVVGLLVTPLDEGGDGSADLRAGLDGSHGRSSWFGLADAGMTNRAVSRSTAWRGMVSHDGRLRAS